MKSVAMNDFVNLDRFEPHFHFARFDLGEIQQAVDQIEQSFGVIKEIVKIFFLQ